MPTTTTTRGRRKMIKNLKECSIDVNLSLPSKDLQRVDASAMKAGLSRSAWLLEAINQAIITTTNR
jgi:predicted DNA binding CopG/RHH family protein